MNELIEQLKSRVGLDDGKAHSAAQTVIDFLKQRLPEPISANQRLTFILSTWSTCSRHGATPTSPMLTTSRVAYSAPNWWRATTGAHSSFIAGSTASSS